MISASLLVEQGRLEEAANLVMNAFRSVLNRQIHGLELSVANFNKIASLLSQKLSDPTSVVTPSDGNLGDAVYTEPAIGKIYITFNGPANMDIPNPVIKVYPVGNEYKIEVPEVPGYTPQIKVIEGTAGSKNLKITVEYVKTPKTPVENIYGQVFILEDSGSDSPRGYVTNPEDDLSVVKATIAGSFYWSKLSEKNTQITSEEEGNYAGVVMHAPYAEEDKLKIVKVRMLNEDGTWTNLTPKEIPLADGEYKSSNTLGDLWIETGPEAMFILWMPITVDMMKNPRTPEHVFQIDWNNDGLYEQTVEINFEPTATELYDAEEDYLWVYEE